MDEWILNLASRLPGDVECALDPPQYRVKEVVFAGRGAREGIWVSFIYTSESLLQVSVAEGERSRVREYFYEEVRRIEHSRALQPLLETLILTLAYQGATSVKLQSRYGPLLAATFKLVLGAPAERDASVALMGPRVRILRTFQSWSKEEKILLPLSQEFRVIPEALQTGAIL